MRYNIVVTDEAEEDLRETARWISQSGLEQAAIWYFNLKEAIESLQNFPLRCPLAPESRTLSSEIRHLLFEKHRILFIVHDETVFVLRIRHGAQDTLKPEE